MRITRPFWRAPDRGRGKVRRAIPPQSGDDRNYRQAETRLSRKENNFPNEYRLTARRLADKAKLVALWWSFSLLIERHMSPSDAYFKVASGGRFRDIPPMHRLKGQKHIPTRNQYLTAHVVLQTGQFQNCWAGRDSRLEGVRVLRRTSLLHSGVDNIWNRVDD